MKSFVSKALLVAIAMVVATGLAEGLLRLFESEIVGMNRQPCVYVRDDTNGYAYRPNSRDRMYRNGEINVPVFINSDGFHDVERGPASNGGGRRVAVIGDSFTAALHVPISNGWTQVLERELSRRQGTACEVRNFGLDGTGTDIQVRILKAQLEKGLKVDTVILAFYRNDPDDVALGPCYREVVDSYVITYQDERQKEAILKYLKDGQTSRRVAAAYRRSYLFRALYNLVRSHSLLRSNFVGPKDTGIPVERRFEPRERLDASFRDLLTLAATQPFTLVVAPVPTKKDPGGSARALTDNVSASVVKELSVVDVVPLLERLRKEERIRYRDLFWRYDGHLNVAGNRLFGLALADVLSNAQEQEAGDHHGADSRH